MKSFVDYERDLEWIRLLSSGGSLLFSELNIPVRPEGDKLIIEAKHEEAIRERVSSEYIAAEIRFK
jgi:hypothetical protein